MRIADSRIVPTYELESAEIALGRGPVAGVDEAGRGPWAGPVVAAAVVLDPLDIPAGIDDSKALTPERRAALYREIVARAEVAVAIADVARIDRDNILGATLWAMASAVGRLDCAPRLVLVDGLHIPPVDIRARAIVRGDAKCLSIAAASIVAKVTRDRIMAELGASHPGYGFERHKGYGTAQHTRALARLGVSAQHRRSFRPVQLALALEAAG